MAEASIDSEDKRMLVSITHTIYPGMIKRGAQVTVSFVGL